VASLYLIRVLDEPRCRQRLAVESALGFAFSPTTGLCVLCLSAAASLVPITAGGAIANVGATAGILLALGVGKNTAISFSLASGSLLITTASAAALAGLALSVATRTLADEVPPSCMHNFVHGFDLGPHREFRSRTEYRSCRGATEAALSTAAPRSR